MYSILFEIIGVTIRSWYSISNEFIPFEEILLKWTFFPYSQAKTFILVSTVVIRVFMVILVKRNKSSRFEILIW